MVFELPRRLTSENAMHCVAEASAALTQSSSAEFVVNAQSLSQFDSSALAVLLELRRKAAVLGKKIVVQSVQPRLIELANLYGVTRVLSLSPAT